MPGRADRVTENRWKRPLSAPTTASDPGQAGRTDAPGGARPATYQRLDLVSPAPYPRDWYLKKLLWELAWRLLYRPTPRQLNRWRVWLLKAFGANIAPTAVVRSTSKVWHPWILTLGEHSCLGDRVTVYNLGPVTIGDHTVLSQDAYICAGTHDYTQPALPLQRPPIHIGSGVWVCAKAFVGPNVTVGDNALVGACAVVTKDVPAGMIVGGNPARVIRPRPAPDAPQGRGA